MKKLIMVVGMAAALVTMGGCATLDKAYNAEVTWTNAPVVKVVTNTVIVTSSLLRHMSASLLILINISNMYTVSMKTAAHPTSSSHMCRSRN